MIPQELIDTNHWVVWKSVKRSGKATKVPFQVNGEPASSTDPATWTNYEEAKKVKLHYDGLGFVFSAEDPFIGIDLDGCRDPKTGEIDQWAKDILVELQTYSEVSPSGTGVKLFALVCEPWVGVNKKQYDGEGHGGKKPGAEVYFQGRYFAVTGSNLKGLTSLANIDTKIDWLRNKLKLQSEVVSYADVDRSSSVIERAAKYIAKMEPAIAGSRGHDAAFKVAIALVKGFALSSEDAIGLFASDYNPRCNPEWSEREIRHKIQQAAKQPGSVGYLSEANPIDWPKIRVPVSVTCEPIQNTETINTTTLRKSVDRYVEELKKGKKQYISTGLPGMDKALGGGIDQGEMVIVAARPSQGKSAIALQMVHELTSKNLSVCFVSEEMSSLMLGKRTIQFLTLEEEDNWHLRTEDIRKDVEKHFANRADAIIIESCGHVEKACTMIEKLQESMQIKAAFVDYAQILNGKGKSKYETVSNVSVSLKQLATRIKLPVIVLAQLSREIEKRPDFVPCKSDLKDSGQLEQDADVIIAGIWPCKMNDEIDEATYKFYVMKNRNRRIVTQNWSVFFNGERQKFYGSDFRMSDQGAYVTNVDFNRDYGP
jgi:DnaB-like helicase C terminal domain